MMTAAILDASVALALLFSETGTDAVQSRIRGGLIGTSNMAEVMTKLVDKGLPLDEAARDIDMLGMETMCLREAVNQPIVWLPLFGLILALIGFELPSFAVSPMNSVGHAAGGVTLSILGPMLSPKPCRNGRTPGPPSNCSASVINCPSSRRGPAQYGSRLVTLAPTRA